jgi:hypothetical protein
MLGVLVPFDWRARSLKILAMGILPEAEDKHHLAQEKSLR